VRLPQNLSFVMIPLNRLTGAVIFFRAPAGTDACKPADMDTPVDPSRLDEPAEIARLKSPHPSSPFPRLRGKPNRSTEQRPRQPRPMALIGRGWTAFSDTASPAIPTQAASIQWSLG
jgi:hypothetical protein